MNKNISKRKHLLLSLKQKIAIGSAVCLIGIGSIGGSIAYLKLQSGQVQNQFSAGTVNTDIEETFNGLVKENVFFSNTGTVPVYIRANLHISWVKAGGTVTSAEVPIANVDYQVNGLPGGNWVIGSDGFYYYKQVLEPGQSTTNLVDSISYDPEKAPEDYVLNVDVQSQSVQAYPAEAVRQVWPGSPVGGGN